MNTDKKVFETLFSNPKTELVSQAYEFALVDDIKSADKFLLASYSEMDKKKQALLDAFKMYKSAIGRTLDTSFTVFALSNKLQEGLKTTGVAVPAEYVAIRNNAQQRQKELQSLFDSVNKAMSQI